MQLIWTENAWDDYLYWQTSNQKMVYKINDLIKDIRRSPFKGIGKPESLKFDLAGKWSRRMNDEHRLVYSINGKKEKLKNGWVDRRNLIIYQCRYHY